EFCQRKPLDCGADRSLVLTLAARAADERAELMAQLGGAQMAAPILPASISSGGPAAVTAQDAPAPWGELEPATAVTVETVTPVDVQTSFALSGPDAAAAKIEARIPAMTPGMW